jgi:hypothetical protein
VSDGDCNGIALQMDVDYPKPAGKSPRPARKGVSQLPSVVPEVEVFVHLLVVLFLMDHHKNEEVRLCRLSLLLTFISSRFVV